MNLPFCFVLQVMFLELNYYFFLLTFKSLVQVSKAQNAQVGLNPSKSKDTKGVESKIVICFFSFIHFVGIIFGCVQTRLLSLIFTQLPSC